MDELTKEQADLQARARSLAAEIATGAAETDRSEAYPWHVVRRMRDEGFFGMTIPRDLGGGGLGYFEAVLVVEELAKACAVAGRIAVEANMGAIGAIMAYGSPAQRRLAADLVLSGDKPAICITEPQAGSAATEMRTTATRHGDRWVIDGDKTWITGGGVSRLHLIFARAIEDGRARGIGGLIVIFMAHVTDASEKQQFESGLCLAPFSASALILAERHYFGHLLLQRSRQRQTRTGTQITDCKSLAANHPRHVSI